MEIKNIIQGVDKEITRVNETDKDLPMYIVFRLHSINLLERKWTHVAVATLTKYGLRNYNSIY